MIINKTAIEQNRTNGHARVPLFSTGLHLLQGRCPKARYFFHEPPLLLCPKTADEMDKNNMSWQYENENEIEDEGEDEDEEEEGEEAKEKEGDAEKK